MTILSIHWLKNGQEGFRGAFQSDVMERQLGIGKIIRAISWVNSFLPTLIWNTVFKVTLELYERLMEIE